MRAWEKDGQEVPASVFSFLREMGKRCGLDVQRAARGLNLQNIQLDRPRGRVDWNELAVFLNRMCEGLSIDEMQEVGKEYLNVNGWMQIALPIFPTPRLFFFCIAEMTRTLPIFPHMRHVVELHADHIRIEHHLPERFEACPFFFQGNVGEYSHINTLFGLPQARIDADASDRHGIYDVFFTDPPTPLDARLNFGDDVFVGFAGEFRQLLSGATSIEEDTALRLSRSAVLNLQRVHGLTLAEARVAARLASGRSVAELAVDLSVSVGTIRSHLKAAYAKTGARRQSDLVRVVLAGSQKVA